MNTQPSSDPVRRLSDQIDAHFDAMLYPGIDPRLAAAINKMRDADHEEVKNRIIAQALSR